LEHLSQGLIDGLKNHTAKPKLLNNIKRNASLNTQALAFSLPPILCR